MTNIMLTWPFCLVFVPPLIYLIPSPPWSNGSCVPITISGYLDDFITLGPGDSPKCAVNVTIAREVFGHLGLPLHPDKCMGPTTCLIFLGIELDSVRQLALLPQEKFTATLELLQRWEAKRWCTRMELESLIGSLHHMSKVIPPGRSFIRQMIDLLSAFRSPSHPIQLNIAFCQDLALWQELGQC